MGLGHEDECFLSEASTLSKARAKLLKRKRVHQVATHIRRRAAQWQPLKRARMSESQNLQTQSLSSDAVCWPVKDLIPEVSKVQKSGKPMRFMFFCNAEWKEFSKYASNCLSQNFVAGNNSVEIDINGRKYVISFHQMMQMNLQTGFLRSIAWVDEHDQNFFPSRFFEGLLTQFLSELPAKSERGVPVVHLCQNLDSTDQSNKVELIPKKPGVPVVHLWQKLDIVHGDEGQLTPGEPDGADCHSLLVRSEKLVADMETSVENHSTKFDVEALANEKFATRSGKLDFALLGNKIAKLQEEDHEYTVVKNKFLAGMGMLVSYTTVVNIYRDSHSSPSRQAKCQAFLMQEEITRKLRGDSNLRYAWHGTSKQGIHGIILHGFGQPKTPKNGTNYGIGVYLAPEDYSHVSAVYSDVDEKDEQHMIMCRVIMGNMEQVQPGSEQFYPSSEDHDSGVDDLINPKRYIIWSTHMNTHILPDYIISFKVSSQWHDIIAALRGMTNQSSSMKRLPSLDLSYASERGEEPKHVAALISSSSQLDNNTSSCTVLEGSSKKSPRSPWMSFPMLFYVLRSKISSTDLITLQRCYIQFKVRRMPRDALIRNVRKIVGDEILAESIRSMQAQEKLNVGLLEFCSNTSQFSFAFDKASPEMSCGCIGGETALYGSQDYS